MDRELGFNQLKELFSWIVSELKSAGVDSPRLEAELILAHLFKITRSEVYLKLEDKIEKDLIERAWELVQKRKKRLPLAYVIKRAWFREIELEINPSVMVPRPETELLVECAIEKILSQPKIKKILDLGTGSGAIILSIAWELAELRDRLEFYASDISREALELAQKNAERLGLEKIIRFYCGDLFEPFAGEKFDLIVCNPPYIPKDEIERLSPEVKSEPKIALDGGESGLEVIERILSQADRYLSLGGWILLEVGAGQAEELKKRSYSFLLLGTIKTDYLGIERIAVFQRI